MIEGFQWGGQLQNTTDVENYPGYPEGIMGPEMMNEFRAQAERFGTRFVTDDADRVELTDGGVQRVFIGDQEHAAKSIVLAMGAEPRRLGSRARWSSPAAAVDLRRLRRRLLQGPEGGRDRRRRLGDGGLDLHLQYASDLDVVHRRDEFRASKIMLDRARQQPNISFKTPYVPEEFLAGDDGKHARSGSAGPTTAPRRRLGWAAHSSRSATSRALSWWPSRSTSTTRATCSPTAARRARTSPGVFAVGDLVDRTYRQAVTAAGTGCMGALDAEWYLRDTPPSPEAHWQRGGEPVEVAPQLAASGE